MHPSSASSLPVFVLLPPARRSPLFPYTTLFRSVFEKAGIGFSHVSGVSLPPTATAARPELAGQPFNALGVDRKSTRLNSSHLGISYAVFCLKQNPARRPRRRARGAYRRHSGAGQ